MKNYTFIELIQSNPNENKKGYKIVLPQIQRDYAQGRIDKTNDNKIKGYDFVLKLINVLTTTDSPALNLDFVYGYTKPVGADIFAFIPLDGQQRLTTLWLLHWFTSPKVETEKDGIKMLSVSDDVKADLNNFTYETRNSSKRFCENLVNKSLSASDDVCATIKDSNWFMSSWLNDPTVVSMLNMLDVIQTQKFDREPAWKNLTEHRKITFDYIDIKSEEFKLNDELYIKMNSRGKLLTEFENFKAQFSEVLSVKDADYVNEKLEYESTKVSFQQYFAFKIDSVWTDLFWSFVMQGNKEKNKGQKVITISDCFMNFFIYIAQMCYYRDKKAEDFKNNDFSIFKRKDNALFLFNVLDFLWEISMDESGQVCINKINNFFENLFQKGEPDETYQKQVRLFEDNGVNLFEKCLLEGNQFDNHNRIILYCLLSYAIKYNLKEVNDGLRYYIRIVRNLLQATRQRNEIAYKTNVCINSFGKYWKLFAQLLEKPNAYERILENIDNNKDTTGISDDALNDEIEKAQLIVNDISNQADIQALFKLEEFKHFRGLIHNLNPKDNIIHFVDWSKYVGEIWNCEDDSMIAASLIACGFGGFYIKKTVFWGKGEHWNTILAGEAKDQKDLSKSIVALLNKYDERKKLNPTHKTENILENIIQECCDSFKKEWQYYFCKYRKSFLSGTNYYYRRKDDEFEQEILSSTGKNPISSYHINPYVKTVSNLLDNEICQEHKCYGRYGNESCLRLENGFHLYCKNNGWKIVSELRQKYAINDAINDDNDVLKETDERDRIEIAVDFCNALYKASNRF